LETFLTLAAWIFQGLVLATQDSNTSQGIHGLTQLMSVVQRSGTKEFDILLLAKFEVAWNSPEKVDSESVLTRG